MDMLKAYAHLFYLVGDMLGSFGHMVEVIRNSNVPFAAEPKVNLLASLNNMLTICSEVNLPVSVKGIERARKQVEAEDVTVRQVGEVLRELNRRIQDELESLRFLYVPPDRALYYQQRIKADDTKRKYRLLSGTAKKKFAHSIEDAEEAANCIALGRYTASVFHMMRIMERGVQRLGKKLKITIPVEEKAWGQISNHINGALKKLPNSTPQEKRIHARYAKAAVYLDNVREAWRNPTMHPKETYTEEEAENVFRFVKQYMDHLAPTL
jgi:HEPN domain-containing protein